MFHGKKILQTAKKEKYPGALTMIIRFPKKIRETFFLDHYKIVLIIAFALIVLSYFFVDIPVAQYFRTLSPAMTALANALTDLINPNLHYYLWPILFLAFRFLWKNQKWANRCLLIFISLLLSNFLAGILKFLLGRARPDLLFSQDLYGFTFFASSNLYKSFPSIHSCTIGVICGAFACFYPRWSLCLLPICLILASTRVALTEHYVSDVIAGVTMGLLISQWIYKMMKKDHFQHIMRK